MSVNGLIFEMKNTLFKLKLKIKRKIRYPINIFLWFAKIAFYGLFNKIIVIDTKTVKSNGGYKYLQILMSKRPVSKKHTYNEF